MELRDFIQSTLVQIVEAIKSANEAIQEKKLGCVNPKFLRVAPEENALHGHIGFAPDNPFVQLIEFDLAITAEKEEQTKGGLGVKVASFFAGAQGASQTSEASVSRVRFRVPVAFPQATYKESK